MSLSPKANQWQDMPEGERVPSRAISPFPYMRNTRYSGIQIWQNAAQGLPGPEGRGRGSKRGARLRQKGPWKPVLGQALGWGGGGGGGGMICSETEHRQTSEDGVAAT